MTSSFDGLPILHQGTNSTLHYREPLVLKVSHPDPSPAQLAQLNNEYVLLKELEVSGVRRSRSIEQVGDRVVLTLEHVPGQTLRTRAPFLSLEEILAVAVASARALHRIHQSGIIHRHITSDHVLIEGGEVTYIDFGIASRLDQVLAPRVGAQGLECTLDYMSPEQTGRMNRVVDLRSDLYSLGATLYEALCGAAPFGDAVDEAELVYRHIAQRPLPLVERVPELPRPISDIICRLLEKNATDRYQSAFGLSVDLEHCLSALQSGGEIPAFELGKHDATGALAIPQHLYGRTTQLLKLLESFGRVAGGARELVLVTGPSGVGKSALINEVHRPLTEQSGYFISGKFEQYNRDLPYSALAEAFDGLCRQLLTEPEARFEQMRAGIREAVGGNGGQLVDIFPRLELLIGQQPPTSDAAPQERQNRLNQAMLQFLSVVCQAEHPLVLFVDDLQWADVASLQLLQSVLSARSLRHLLVLGAYRDNEVDEAHPLQLVIEHSERSATPIQRLALGALPFDDLNRLVGDALSREDCAELTRAIVSRTQGNAFFSIEAFKWLYEGDALQFEFRQQAWHYDLAQVQALLITNDAVVLTTAKINRLDEPAVAALARAACIGHLFDLETLSVLCECSESDTLQRLWGALERGFIIPLDNNYRLFGAVAGEQSLPTRSVEARFRFTHDRVHQAAYSNPEGLDEDRRILAHLKIGRTLQARHTEPDEAFFAGVGHLNKGCSAMAPEERAALAMLNLRAGRRALKAAAYTSAIGHFEQSLELLPSGAWSSHYQTVFDATLSMAEACHLTGAYERADTLYRELSERVQRDEDRVRIRVTQAVQYNIQHRLGEALAVEAAGLALLGVVVPKDDIEARAQLEIELKAAHDLIGDRPVGTLIDMPRAEKPEVEAALLILSCLWLTAYVFGNRQPLVLWTSVKMASLTLQRGQCALSPIAFCYYAFARVELLDDYDGGYELGRLAVAMSERGDNLSVRSTTYDGFLLFNAYWKQPARELLDAFRKACAYGMSSGAYSQASFTLMFTIYHSIACGRDLEETYEEALRYRRIIEEICPSTLTYFLPACVQHAACLRGLTPDPACLDGNGFSEVEHARKYADNPLRQSWVFSPKLQLLYHFGRDREALSQVHLSDQMAAARPGQPVQTELAFFSSLILARGCAGASDEDRQRMLNTMARYRVKLAEWAGRCEANFLHKLLLVDAERDRVLGKLAQSAELYDQAILSASEHRFVNHAALASELAGRFWLERDAAKAASYLQQAVGLYEEWGATAKVDYLRETYAV